MTVPASSGHIEYIADGATYTFAYDFRIDSRDEIEVRIDDAPFENILLSGVGTDEGGNVYTVDYYPPEGSIVSIRRTQPLEQLLHIVPNAGISAVALEGRLDAIVKQVQFLREELSRRPAVVVGAPESQREMVLPIEASKVLAINSDATGFELLDPTTATALVTDPLLIDDHSGSLGQFQTATSPGEIGSESLPTNLSGEIERLRYAAYSAKHSIDPVVTTWYQTAYSGNGGFNVSAFGAVGDGIVNSKSAIQAAFAAGRHVHFDAGTYYIGNLAGGETAFDLTTYGDGIKITTNGRVRIVCNSTSSIPYVFKLRNNSFFHCDSIEFEDTGFDIDVNWLGAFAFYLTNATAGDWGNLTFEKVTCVNMVGGIVCNHTAPNSYTHRIRGITIKELTLTDCYYGFVSQDEGDNIVIERLNATRCRRAYFAYGMVNHVGNIYIEDPYFSNGSIAISRQVGGNDTRDIILNVVVRNITRNELTTVHFTHVDLLGGNICGVKIHLDIIGTGGLTHFPVLFTNYVDEVASAAPSLNTISDIHLSGSASGEVESVSTFSSFLTKGAMSFTPGLNFTLDPSIYREFHLDEVAARAQPLTWTTLFDQPDIGNGTLTHSVDIVEGICTVHVHLVFGSTTNPGTGFWVFSGFTPTLPATATACGSWVAWDFGTAFYCGATKIPMGLSAFGLFADGAADGLGATIPFTWGESDVLDATISYPVS